MMNGKMVQESENSLKKRKWDDHEDKISEKPEKVKIVKPILDTFAQHETPLPLEWQRCLDIKSGELYFYNTRTQKRTLSDPRSTINPEPLNPSPMSLDLELNLPCGSLEKKNDIQEQHNSFMMKQNSSGDNTEPGSGLTRSPSWLTCEGEQQEMVTAVCEKCYMLVMMYKSSPACPNCKFMHPPDTSPKLFNPRLSLLC
ncbi:uncharacterized protein LOC111376399 [Olea europaea var. sylvestris]|uniref:uncharacterized protein LOC111376399 n=1 Tax=Olea europaea var. sylvestris TaxID=158386 RepID=UPI000C1D6FE9|nr:uncharacterized protein LOC111376399 [Olea europaea var. sylvestris]